MIDYKKELNMIVDLLKDEHYNLIINRSSWLMEQAFKSLFNDQLSYFKTIDEASNERIEYQSFQKIIEDNFPHFDIDKITLGGLIKLYHLTRLFNLIENRLDVRLTFTKRVQWIKVRNIRNKVVHDANYQVEKTKAFDFIHYVKILISETKLNTIDADVSEYRCHDCNSLVDEVWNYCSNCGADLGSNCKKCNTLLKQSWTICPQCHTPRTGVKTKNPDLMYNHYCEAVWADGVMTKEERIFLNRKREELGINKENAVKIEEYHAPRNVVRFRDMVEATLIDGVIDEQERVYLRNKTKELEISKDIANEIFLVCLLDDSNETLFHSIEQKVIQLKQAEK